MSGKLILIPTPIGNLDDITLRALRVLKTVDVILCEDTRHSGQLLKHHQIENKLSPFHQHNEHKVTDRLIEQLSGGSTMALVTDAGTPGVSDPGYLLLRACVEANIPVEVMPGATAVIPAIVGSGLPCDRYTYLGFPPQKKGRQTFWKELADEQHTMVMYESPHRIMKALSEAAEHLDEERMACVARELTKLHETYHRGTIAELIKAGEKTPYKGEIVLIIEGKAHFDKRMKA